MKSELQEHRPGWQFADFDCFIEYQFPTLETIRGFIADPEWQEVLKDQRDWVDIPKALISLGHSTSYVLGGKPVGSSN